MTIRQTSLAALVALPVALNADVVLIENFDYADGRLVDASAGAWVVHSGTRALNVQGGHAVIEQPDTTGGGEDVNRLFSMSFDPAVDNTTALYAALDVTFSSLPVNNGDHTSGGSYFAHFKSSAASEFYARLGANMDGAASGMFRLGIANESWSSALSYEYPQDLSLGVTYNLMIRLDLATDQATLWVNPANEASTSVTASGAISYSGSINSFALRQGTSGSAPNDGSTGSLTVDNLRVGTSFAEVQAVPEPSTFALFGLGALALLLRKRS